MGGEAGGEAKRCRGEGPLCVRAAGRRSAPAGRARGCRAACAERAWSARRGKAGAAARQRGGQEHPQRRSPPSTVRSSVPPVRRAGPRSSPVASTGRGACGPGGAKRRRRPPETASGGHPCRGLRSGSGGWWYLLSSAPTSRPAVRCLQGPARGQRSLAASQAKGPAPNSPILSVGYRSPQRQGVCSRPSRSGKGHESLESGWMLKAAALYGRPQPLFSQSPASSDAGFSRFFSPRSAPGVLFPLAAWPPPPRHPHFPSLLSLPPSILSPSLSSFCIPIPLSPACFSSHTALPSLPSHPLPPRPPPPLSVDPSLCSSSPICFSSAQPRPITSFLYLSPDSPCVSSPPTASLIPGPER